MNFLVEAKLPRRMTPLLTAAECIHRFGREVARYLPEHRHTMVSLNKHWSQR